MAGYQVGVYYFPNYHADARNALVHGPGGTEWELVKRGEPKFPGHRQPKVPLWGYEDEADPRVMAKKIDAAADHGIHHFLFDWYWYDDGPFLQRALDEGFLGAANNQRLKFALMWANHDWTDIHPARRHGRPALLYPGMVTRESFDALVEVVIERYFRHPSYWQIDGCPYFSIYELMTLVRGLGGLRETRDALARFHERTRAAGFPELHLNAVVWGVKVLPNEEAIANPREMLAALGFDSVSSYVWVHHVPLTSFPTVPYETVARAAAEHWRQADAEYGLPFHPNVTMGWDSSPRTVQSDVYEAIGYPFGPVIEGNTPERFKAALQAAKAFLDARPAGPKILSINAWNEWTEGSYLEPDTEHEMAYLEAVRAVFGAGS
jgi:glycosyl transferase family WbsX